MVEAAARATVAAKRAYEPRLPRTQARTEAEAGAADRRRRRLGRRRRWRLGRLSGSVESFAAHSRSKRHPEGWQAKRRDGNGKRASVLTHLTTVQMRDERFFVEVPGHSDQCVRRPVLRAFYAKSRSRWVVDVVCYGYSNF